MYQAALALHEQVSGKDSPETVDGLLRIGLTDLLELQLEDAEAVDRHALAVAQAEKPQNLIRLAKAEGGVGRVLQEQGKASEAVLLFHRALQDAKAGARDLDLQEDLEIGISLADASLGDLDQARRHNREALRIARQLKGEHHPDVAASLLTANEFDVAAGDYPAAEKEAREAWFICKDWLGPDHPQTLDAQRILAQDLKLLGRDSKAESLLENAISIDARTRPEPHKQTAMLHNALGLVEQKQGKLKLAEGAFNQALKIYDLLYHGRDYKQAITLDNLAALAFQRKELQKAELFSRKALAMFLQTTAPLNHFFLTANARLGMILDSEHKDKEAEGVLLASLAQFKPGNAPASEGEKIRQTLNKLYLKMGDKEKAQRFAGSLVK